MTTIKALTVRQPFATAIVLLGKPVENRTQRTRHRGPLAIHAAAAPYADLEAARTTFDLAGVPYTAPERDPLGMGAVIGVVNVVGCHPAYTVASERGCVDGDGLCSPWAVGEPGVWHWELADPEPLFAPVPCAGALGLWSLEERDPSGRAVAAVLPMLEQRELAAEYGRSIDTGDRAAPVVWCFTCTDSAGDPGHDAETCWYLTHGERDPGPEHLGPGGEPRCLCGYPDFRFCPDRFREGSLATQVITRAATPAATADVSERTAP